MCRAKHHRPQYVGRQVERGHARKSKPAERRDRSQSKRGPVKHHKLNVNRFEVSATTYYKRNADKFGVCVTHYKLILAYLLMQNGYT